MAIRRMTLVNDIPRVRLDTLAANDPLCETRLARVEGTNVG